MKPEEDLAKTLKHEAELAELEEDSDDDVWVRWKPARQRSMVYSVRIPVDRVEELRQVAATEGLDPSAMVRHWVLERLDSAREGRPEEELVSLFRQVASTVKQTGWSLVITPDADLFRPYLLELPTSTKTKVKLPGMAAKAAPAMNVPVKAAPAKREHAKAAAAKKVTGVAKAVPSKRTKSD